MSSETRRYALKARAESQRKTRERIAKAASELHEERGVAQTTVAEIARRADVSRLTVYNHFPDLEHLLPACAAHYEALHPAPDLEHALSLEDPCRRASEALTLLFAWYREVEPMFGKLFNDRATVPELDEFMAGRIDQLQARIAGELAAAYGDRGARAIRRRALARLAVDFPTWRRLDSEALDDEAAAALMAETIAGA